MKLPLRHLQINPQGNEFADDHPDYPKDAGQCMRNGHDYDAILDADGEIVADNAGYYPTGIDRDAAARIVRCVNMHDELVDTFELLIDNISPEAWEALPQYVQEQVMQAFNNAKAEA